MTTRALQPPAALTPEALVALALTTVAAVSRCPMPGCAGRAARFSPRSAEVLLPFCAPCRETIRDHHRRHPGTFLADAPAAVAAAHDARTAWSACPVCGRPSAPARACTPAWQRPLCAPDRQRAQELVAKGRATPATALARLAARPWRPLSLPAPPRSLVA